MKLYDPPREDVIEAAGCTWCGADVGQPCRTKNGYYPDRYNSDLPGGPGTAHAQRWKDFWNEISEPKQQLPVYERYGRHAQG